MEEAGETDLWRGRHGDWYATLAARCEAEWIGPDQVEWIERWDAEHANLRAALGYAVGEPLSAPAALRICQNLENYWFCAGLVSEARHWVELALAHGTGTDAERGLGMRLGGYFAAHQKDFDHARQLLEQARPLVESSSELKAHGHLLAAEGMLAALQGQIDVAIPLGLKSLESFRSAGDLNGEVKVLYLAGVGLSLSQQFELGADLLQQALALTEPCGELYTRSSSLWALGLGSLGAGDVATATKLEQQALRMKWALQDLFGTGYVLEALGWAAAAEDRGERAATLIGAAEAMLQVVGVPITQTSYLLAQREIAQARARDLLGLKAFEAAFAAGAALATKEAIAVALEEATEPQAGTAQKSVLTRREQEVARLVNEGLSNREIAETLVISQRTAQSHVENILRKLSFSSRAQVAAWVAGNG